MIRLILAAVLFSPLAASAAAITLLEAQNTSYASTDAREAILSGNVHLSAEGLELTADEGRYNLTTGVARISGHVVLTSNLTIAGGNVAQSRTGQRLLADTLVYNFTDDTFTASNVRLGSYPYYVMGATASGSRNEITINDATATLGEPGPFAPVTKAAQIVVAPGKNVRFVGARVGVGSAIPLHVPAFRQNMHEPILSLLTFTTGYRGSLGASVDVGLHLPMLPGFELGGDVGVYTSRGVMAGPSGSYASPTDPDSLSGSFRSGYINDYGDKKTDILGRPVPENRAYAEWNHRQTVGEHLTLTGAFNYWKDSEIVRDFRPDVFSRDQQPDTYGSAVYAGPNALLSLFARFQPNKFHDVQERLPELSFDLLPTAIGLGFFEQLHASAVRLQEDPPLGGTTLKSDRFDATYELRKPMATGDWFAFTPVIGGRITHYSDTQGAVATGDFTRGLGEVGFDAELRSSATFDAKNEIWKIDGLRHLVTPILGYRYVFHGDRGRAYIPQIDRTAFDTSLPPLGLGSARAIDDLHTTHVLRLGIDNTLQTRDGEYGSRDLVTFNNAMDIQFHREPGQHVTSDIHSELTVAPAPWLRFNLNDSFSPRDATLSQLDTGLTLLDGDAWSLRFANHFLRQDTEVYSIDGTRRLNENYDISARFSYDARHHRFDEQALALRQHLANTWLVEYAVTLYDGPRRESKFGLNIRVRMLSF